MTSRTALLLIALAGCGPSDDPGLDDKGSVDDTDAPAAAVDPGPVPDAEPGPVTVPRLSQRQYEHAIRDLVAGGRDLVEDGWFVPSNIEPGLRLDGLDALGSTEVSLSPRGVSRFEQAAYSIAGQALAADRRDQTVPCTPTEPTDEGCAATFFRDLGRRAWRRPLSGDEVDALVDVSQAATAVFLSDYEAAEYPSEAARTEALLESWYDGAAYGMAALLQSPDFLMRFELGAPAEGGVRLIEGFELASRLSFFLWDTIPDDALLDAAADGRLDTEDGLLEQVERMMGDPRLSEGVAAWTTDLFDLDAIADLQKDPTVFEHVSDQFLKSAVKETLLVVDDLVVTQDADFRDLLTTKRTFLDRTLASIYDVRAPVREGFGPTDLPEDGERAGLLGQASVLALYAHPTSSSATKRGRFVRETLLCQSVPPPPGNVDTSIPEPSPDAPTLRDRIKSHLEVQSCANCHLIMDPPGLTLEQFDGIGRFRTTEAGATIDVSGDIDGEEFVGLLGLAQAIREHQDFAPCMVDQVARYALGRDPADEEEPIVRWLEERFAFNGYRMKSLWTDFVTSPMFRQVGEAE